MKTEIQSIDTALPSGSKAYIFGSILRRPSANDIDLIIVYDPVKSPPAYAYRLHREFLEFIQSSLKKRVDLILLSHIEQAHSLFIESVGAVSLSNNLFLKLVQMKYL